MEGYSVTEAASILGVPTERVWELLARGVLAGTPEGETGMRVYLQPRPAPAPVEPARPNGNGGNREPERELSPFRELLTEFRNLTERYGQALLALGEARGEVAALRSRVDLLEARMDLRLPASTGPLPAPSWPAPQPTVPRAAAAAAPPPRGDEVPEPDTDGDAAVRTARRHAARRATESFAEALARAEDPSIPDLPGGTEAGDAVAALLREAAASDVPAGPEAALPRELPPADEVPVADEAAPADEMPEPEPEPETEAEAEPEPEAPAEPDASADREPETEPEAEAEQFAEAEREPEPEPQPEAQAQPERPASPDEGPAPEEPAAAAAEGRAEADVEAAEAPPSTDEPVWQDERYTAEIGEPDWYEAEAFPEPAVELAPEPAVTEENLSGTSDEADAQSPEAAAISPEPGQRPAPSERVTISRLRPAGETAADEETVLWFGRSRGSPAADAGDADEMEVAPTGRPGAAETAPLPGSHELEDALAALDAIARPSAEAASAPQEPPLEEPTADERATTDRPSTERRAPLRPAPTPASRAYRRLRRIFPG
jgi:hypothetical protein